MKISKLLIVLLCLFPLIVLGQDGCKKRKPINLDKQPFNSNNKIICDRFYHTISAKPTKLGKLLLRFHYPFFSQWDSLKHKLIKHIGPIISDRAKPLGGDISKQKSIDEIVFVTLGTRPQGFPRLLKTVEALAKERFIEDKIVAQRGCTDYRTDIMETFDFCAPEEIDRYIGSAKYIITQESAGIVTKCLKAGKRFIVMPRDYKYRELPTKSDMNEDLHFKLAEMGFTYVVHDQEQLKKAIMSISQLKTGFSFNNQRAITYLTNLIESS